MFIITGGGSGIGQALANRLANQGHSVLIIGRRIEALMQTASLNDRIAYFQADISGEEGRQALVDYLSGYKNLSGLVHNAGTISPIKPITELSLKEFQQTMAVNVEAPLRLSQALVGKLASGRVLHVGSGAAYFPVQGWAAYCTSKAALSMITRCWQLECQDPVFASVTPGIIDSPMQSEIRQSQGMDPERRQFFHALKDSHRLVSCETVALFLAWLLLDVDKDDYPGQEWDIYDESHHHHWLIPPHQVPSFED